LLALNVEHRSKDGSSSRFIFGGIIIIMRLLKEEAVKREDFGITDEFGLVSFVLGLFSVKA